MMNVVQILSVQMVKSIVMVMELNVFMVHGHVTAGLIVIMAQTN